MPKQAPDYSKSVIYKIVRPDWEAEGVLINDIYVGSTTDLIQREAGSLEHRMPNYRIFRTAATFRGRIYCSLECRGAHRRIQYLVFCLKVDYYYYISSFVSPI